jgi:glucose-1-phosphate thymidylyltransferase
MKGIVLAGGLGTRLLPLTKITNKHLLPVYDRPMVHYPLQALVRAGIEDIMVVSGGNYSGEFMRLLGDGADLGIKHINYAYQKGEGGIAEALGLTEHFVGGDSMVVVLGDNIFQDDLGPHVSAFEKGACIFVKKVENVSEFGVVEIKKDRVVGIEEKPKRPKSNYAQTGIYFYDQRVFDIVKSLEPSKRGELEITDVNNQYLEWGELDHKILDGFWIDAGMDVNSLFLANCKMAEFAG